MGATRMTVKSLTKLDSSTLSSFVIQMSFTLCKKNSNQVGENFFNFERDPPAGVSLEHGFPDTGSKTYVLPLLDTFSLFYFGILADASWKLTLVLKTNSSLSVTERFLIMVTTTEAHTVYTIEFEHAKPIKSHAALDNLHSHLNLVLINSVDLILFPALILCVVTMTRQQRLWNKNNELHV